MTKEQLIVKIKQICPEMLMHENFMHAAECMFCKEIPNDRRKQMTADEFSALEKLHDKLCTATIAEVIKHLQDNFKLNDKLCYMDCVQGCKNDCTYITKDQLGKRFFYYVKDLKKQHNDEMFSHLDDADVVVC